MGGDARRLLDKPDTNTSDILLTDEYVKLTQELLIAATSVEKRRELHETSLALEKTKEEARGAAEVISREEEHLKTKVLHLQQQLVRFNKFLRDNQVKVGRAKQRRAADEAGIAELEQTLLRTNAEIAVVTAETAVFREEIAAQGACAAFLARLAPLGDVHELIARWELLEQTRARLETQLRAHRDAAIRAGAAPLPSGARAREQAKARAERATARAAHAAEARAAEENATERELHLLSRVASEIDTLHARAVAARPGLPPANTGADRAQKNRKLDGEAEFAGRADALLSKLDVLEVYLDELGRVGALVAAAQPAPPSPPKNVIALVRQKNLDEYLQANKSIAFKK